MTGITYFAWIFPHCIEKVAHRIHLETHLMSSGIALRREEGERRGGGGGERGREKHIKVREAGEGMQARLY